MSIVYLIDVLWVFGCLGGGFFYGARDDRFGPIGGGVAGLVAAVCGVIIVGVLLGHPTAYRPL